MFLLLGMFKMSFKLVSLNYFMVSFSRSNILLLMDLRSLKFHVYSNTAWHVGAKSIFAVGKVMVSSRIRGFLLLIWAMLRNLLLNMSVVCLCLGSQRPEGGVVLGPDRSLSTYVQLSIIIFVWKYFKVLKYYSLYFMFACHLVSFVFNIYVFVNTYIWLCVLLCSSSILRF